MMNFDRCAKDASIIQTQIVSIQLVLVNNVCTRQPIDLQSNMNNSFSYIAAKCNAFRYSQEAFASKKIFNKIERYCNKLYFSIAYPIHIRYATYRFLHAFLDRLDQIAYYRIKIQFYLLKMYANMCVCVIIKYIFFCLH